MGNRNINIQQGNYNERIDGDNIQGDVIIVEDGDSRTVISQSPNGNTIVNQQGNMGIGVMSGGTIGGNAKVASNITQINTNGDNIAGMKIQSQVAQQIVNMDSANGLHIGDVVQVNNGGSNVSQVALSNIQVGGDISISGIHQTSEKMRRQAEKAQRNLQKQARKAQRNWTRITQQQSSGNNSINIQGGTINADGAGTFSLSDITGTVANTVNQIFNTSGTQTGRVKSNDTVYLNEDETPEIDETFRINMETLVEMVKLSTVNMPVDASRIERFVIANEIVERIEGNPDLVALIKESPEGMKAALNLKLGDGYKLLVALVVDELNR